MRKNIKYFHSFTLIEIMLALVIVGIIAGLASIGGKAVIEKTQRHSAIIKLTTVQSEVARLGSKNRITIDSTSLVTLPNEETILANISDDNMQATRGESLESNQISIYVVDPTIAVYAVFAGNRCLYLVDYVEERTRWAYSLDQCLAGNVDTQLAIQYSLQAENPTEISN
jgi:hypothetical protein